MFNFWCVSLSAKVKSKRGNDTLNATAYQSFKDILFIDNIEILFVPKWLVLMPKNRISMKK